MKLDKLCSPLLFLSLTASSQAIVQAYYVNYYSSQAQTNDGAPTDTPVCGFQGAIYCDTYGDMFSGTLTRPDASVESFWFSPDTTLVFYSPGYSDLATLDANYPAGTYNFSIDSGTFAPDNQNIVVQAPDFPDAVPYFTGGSWSALQNAPPLNHVLVQWTGWGHPGTSTNQVTGLSIYDYTKIESAYTASGPQNEYQSDLLPAGIMKSGHTYGTNLAFYSYNQEPGMGFGGAYETVEWYRQTTGQFHVKADPGTVSGQIVLNDYYYPVGETVVAQVCDTDGTVLEEQNVLVGVDGWYAFDTTETGTKTIKIKGRIWLRQAMPGVDLTVGQDSTNFTLQSGDCNNDNTVDLTDYTRVVVAFNAVPSSGNWEPTADLNGDSVIDLSDYTIVVTNFNRLGD